MNQKDIINLKKTQSNLEILIRFKGFKTLTIINHKINCLPMKKCKVNKLLIVNKKQIVDSTFLKITMIIVLTVNSQINF